MPTGESNIEGQHEVIALTGKQLDEVLDKTIARALTRFGIDVNNPLEQQRDMQFTRDLRKSTEQTGTMTKGAMIVMVISTIGGGCLLVFKTFFPIGA